MTAKPQISVIIPVYNTASYLEQCLNSVCSQTISDIEVLCVDDCSKDNSLDILQQYARNDSRVNVFHHSINMGCAAARNTGMRHSTGNYLYFIDSDDWIDPGYLEEVFTLAEKHRLPLIYNSRIMWEMPEGTSTPFEPGNYAATIGFGTTGFVDSHKNIGNFSYSNCCCLYRRDYLKKLRVSFPEGLDYTDNFFHIATFLPQKEIYVTNNNTYHYRVHENSICAKDKNSNQGNDIIEVYEIILKYYIEHAYITTCKLNFYELKKHIPYLKDVSAGYKRIHLLFSKCIDIIHKYSYLYTDEEICFFDLVCKCPNYNIYQNVLDNKKRFSTLRGRVQQTMRSYVGDIHQARGPSTPARRPI